MLPAKLAHTLRDTHQRLIETGELYPLDTLNSYYATFRQRFGPDALKQLEGEELIVTMHRHNNRNSLVYWLEFKKDNEFPDIFGSIAGGSALKFGVYQSAKTGAWMSRSASNYPEEISLAQAIEIARRHRDQFLRGAALLRELPANASESDYQDLQRRMDEEAPAVSKLAWGHKYFSLLYPNKIDDYHSAYYQRFHLVKLLQSNIPEERAGRYIAAGRFVEAAKELEMPMNHLTTVLNVYNGQPYRYWSIHASNSDVQPIINWNMQREGGFAAILWSALGNLADLKHDSPSKKLLYERIEQFEPRTSTSERQSVFSFVTDIAIHDRIVAFEPREQQVVGVGRVTSDYYFETSSSLAPHRRSVEWLNTPAWHFPTDEGFNRSTREILSYANQVEIERHLLEEEQFTETSQPAVVLPWAEPVLIDDETISKIFISYRHKSWGIAQRIVEELKQHLKADIFVDFIDVDEADFERSILRHLNASDAVLLVISEYTFEDRIHQDSDWIRLEIREALSANKPLILACVDGRMPPANLPDDIKDVSRMHAVNIYREHFKDSVKQIAQFVEKILVTDERQPVPPLPLPSRSTLEEALHLMETGDFQNAVVLLEKLRAAGYKSRYVKLDELINQARISVDVLHAAKSDYEEIVMLASRKVTLEQAQAAFSLWCQDHPAWVESLDTQNLRDRFKK